MLTVGNTNVLSFVVQQMKNITMVPDILATKVGWRVSGSGIIWDVFRYPVSQVSVKIC